MDKYKYVKLENTHQRALNNDKSSFLMNSTGEFTPPGISQMISTQDVVLSGVIGQKFYTLHGQTPSDFVEIKTGEASYSDYVKKRTSASVGQLGNSFFTPGSGNISKKSQTNAKFSMVEIKNNFWRDEYQIDDTTLKQAAINRTTFSLITELEKARYTKYQLEVQEALFKGIEFDSNISFGLLNNPDININTSLIPINIQSMDLAELKELLSELQGAFNVNSKGTALANTWCMPTSTYLGLMASASSIYPGETILDQILKSFKHIQGFKIVHSMYQEAGALGAGSKPRHVLYNRGEDTAVMYHPLVYTPYGLLASNGYDYASVAEAQFTGVLMPRPREVLYIDVTTP